MGADDIDYMQKRSSDIVQLVINSLKDRLGNISDFVSLKIFNVERIRKLKVNSPQFTGYGERELKALIAKYNLQDDVFDVSLQYKRLAVAYSEKKAEDFYDLALRLKLR